MDASFYKWIKISYIKGSDSDTILVIIDNALEKNESLIGNCDLNI